MAAIVVAVPLVGAAAPAQPTRHRGLHLSLKTGKAHESDGKLVVPAKQQGDDGELRQVARLSTGEAALITLHKALPVAKQPAKPATSRVSAAQLKRAKNYPGLLPQSMVPTKFTTDGKDIVKTGTLKMKPLDASKLAADSMSAATPTTFTYTWTPIGDHQVVKRDGQVITNTSTGNFEDDNLKAEATYTYSIDSYAADGGIVSSQEIPVTTPTSSAVQTQAGQAKLLTRQAYVSEAIYRTFIPDSRVHLDLAATLGCGQAGQGSNRTFGGDNRGFVTPPASAPFDSTSSRTSLALNVNWDNPAPYDLNWVKSIGTSHLYDGTKLIDQRTASADGIVIDNAYSTSSYAQAHVSHDVGNPFCIAGSIQYNVTFRWYRNGQFQVIGWRYPVPNHEIYGGWDNGSGLVTWHPFGTYKNEGFDCLTGQCGTRDVNVTKSY